MKKLLTLVGVLLGGLAVLLAIAGLAVWFGAVDVAADTPHSAAVFRLLEAVRERSIAAQVDEIRAPELSDPAAIRRGAGNYDSMCATCHLVPDAHDTEISRGLYPAPPNLAREAPTDPARAFWIIKHGIKATGMPAWGKSMEDRYIWDMVAFLQKLPAMSAEQYAHEVEASGGHSHGGGETSDASQAQSSPGSGEHAHDEAPEKSGKPVHVHRDGKEHVHD